MRKKRCSILLALLAALFVVTIAQGSAPLRPAIDDCYPFEDDGSAKPDKDCPCSEDPSDLRYCASANEYLMIEISDSVRIGLASLQEYLVKIYWLLARVVVYVAEMLIKGEFWETMRDSVMEQLRTVMGGKGGVLAQLIGGGSGLFFVALMLAGFIMVLPFLGQSHIVKPDRVILWGVLLVALFAGGTQGFDLIEQIEKLRVTLMQTAAGVQNSDSLAKLVTAPMMATTDDVHTIDEVHLLVLPAQFQAAYFWPIQPDAHYREFRVRTGSLMGQEGLEFIFVGKMADPGDPPGRPGVLERKQGDAIKGVVRMAYALYTTYVMALFGVLFALLTATSLVLIVLFIAFLPLGFFEFGTQILGGLIKQYLGVVGLSLFAGVLVRLLTAVFDSILAAGAEFTVAGMMTSIATLAIVTILLMFGIKLAWGLADGTLGVLEKSVSMVGSAAFATGGGPLGGAVETGKQALGTAVTATTAAAAGAVTGGVGAALVAGAGGMLSGTKAGSTASSLAGMALPDSRATQLFQTATATRSPLAAARGVVAVNRQFDQADRQAENVAKSAYGGAVSYREAALDPRWQAVDMGGSYLTADLGSLAQAEKAFFQAKKPDEARRLLEQTFGSRRVADHVAGIYQNEGSAGAKRVRRIVETAQSTATDLTNRGAAVVTPNGQVSAEYGQEVYRRLAANKLLDPKDREAAASAGLLVGSAVRTPVSIWNDPQAAAKLAHDTLHPEAAEVSARDVSAQYALRDLAAKLTWDEGQLTALFETVRRGVADGLRGSVLAERVSADLGKQSIFRSNTPAEREEAARLAALSAEGAQVQRPGGYGRPTDARPAQAVSTAMPGAASPAPSIFAPAAPNAERPATAAPQEAAWIAGTRAQPPVKEATPEIHLPEPREAVKAERPPAESLRPVSTRLPTPEEAAWIAAVGAQPQVKEETPESRLPEPQAPGKAEHPPIVPTQPQPAGQNRLPTPEEAAWIAANAQKPAARDATPAIRLPEPLEAGKTERPPIAPAQPTDLPSPEEAAWIAATGERPPQIEQTPAVRLPQGAQSRPEAQSDELFAWEAVKQWVTTDDELEDGVSAAAPIPQEATTVTETPEQVKTGAEAAPMPRDESRETAPEKIELSEAADLSDLPDEPMPERVIAEPAQRSAASSAAESIESASVETELPEAADDLPLEAELPEAADQPEPETEPAPEAALPAPRAATGNAAVSAANAAVELPAPTSVPATPATPATESAPLPTEAAQARPPAPAPTPAAPQGDNKPSPVAESHPKTDTPRRLK